MKPKISVVINTLNEEKNLPYALRSVSGWADEIIVVDMYSDDYTVEIAKEYGAKVFFHERIAAFDGARQFAIDQASNEWILILDADELVPKTLSKKLQEIAAMQLADIVSIPRYNYLLGAHIKYSGWGPEQDRQKRFFRKGIAHASSKIHAFLHSLPEARVYNIPYEPDFAIIHFNYINCDHFLEKLNRYTNVEASQAYDRGEKISIPKSLFLSAKEFLNRYFRKQGFRDGWRGFYLSLFMAFYRLSIYCKLIELKDVGTRSEVIAQYHDEAERILSEYTKEN
ncbi:MAG: glycosyltransferase family 2 protein [Thermoprotei archaeon]